MASLNSFQHYLPQVEPVPKSPRPVLSCLPLGRLRPLWCSEQRNVQAKNEPTRELPFELLYLFRVRLSLCLIRSALHRRHPFICPPTEVGFLIDLKSMRRSIPL